MTPYLLTSLWGGGVSWLCHIIHPGTPLTDIFYIFLSPQTNITNRYYEN